MGETQEPRTTPRAHYRRNGGVVFVTIVAALVGVFSAVSSDPPRPGPGPAPASTQVLAAHNAQTNLPTENTRSGAQSPPYVCCWNANGQYVTFTFTASGGSTNLGLRYSAANASAYRRILLDGAVWVTKQTFSQTSTWSTWKTLTLNTLLMPGTHTLKVSFDTVAASGHFMNLDNLTVTSVGTWVPPPTGVAVALGYADGALGIQPWSGSNNTTFIGDSPHCCLSYGADVGKSGYDSGAIEIWNGKSTAITVNAVTADFSGGSSPSHFDIWGGGTAGRLPKTIAPGGQLVLTMSSGFNFDTTDLLGEACALNSGAVATVHITIDGAATDYRDDHQILNRDGTDLVGCPGATSEQVPFALVSPGAQPPARPVNELAPSIAGVATVSRVLSGFAGGWHGSPPPALALQWTRCTSTGTNCVAVAGATGRAYRPVPADAGRKLRFQVTATNSSGSTVVSSKPSAPIASGPTVGQLGNTSTGATSRFVVDGNEIGSTFSATASGTTNDFEFFARGGGNAQKFTPRLYTVVNGQRGSLLATGATINVPQATVGKWYVSSLSGVTLQAGAQYFLALDPSGAFNGTYVGSENQNLGPLSVFVDYTP